MELGIVRIFLGIAALVSTVVGAGELPSSVDSFLDKNCFECHDDSVSKGDLNLLELPFDPDDPHNFERWVRVFDRVEHGEMPPEKKPRPESGDLSRFLTALEPILLQSDEKRVEEKGRTSVRRLTRREYEYTIHDLLGIDLPLTELLPKETGVHIFETTAKSQQLSHHLLSRYLDAAEVSLEEAFERALEGDEKFSRRVDAWKLGRGSWSGGNYRGPENKDGRVIAWPIRLQFYGRMPGTKVPRSGWYEITIEDLQAVNHDVVWGTLKSGACSSAAPILYPIGNVEATRKKRTLVFRAWIREGHMLELKPADATTPRAKIRTNGGSVSFKGYNLEKDGTHGIAFSGISLKRIYPNAQASLVRQKLFGKLDKSTLENVSPEKRNKLIRETIHRFANRAFRRPTSREQTEPYLQLAGRILQDPKARPSEALFDAYRAILCSPRFLTFYEKPGKLDQHALASRLSYMVWNSMPDSQLRSLADQSKLKGEVIPRQFQRMLMDPKGERFVASFTDQWLKLNEINFTSPDNRYRTFDQVVQQSLVDETRSFFKEMLVGNRRIHNLIHSDFAMLDERLVRYYGMKNIELKSGEGIQKVRLGENQRGGLITQGSVLKVTADGSVTSPIIRGVYLNERILGREIPPPPPGVPAVEPDIRGAMSIRDQLKKHKDSESCRSCHVKIDPPGFAFENFDPVGLWRNQYGTKKSTRVDASGVTPEGHEFSGIVEWKKIYYQQPERLVSAFSRHLLTYATGAEPGFSDRAAIDQIVAKAKKSQFRMQPLVSAVLSSEPFLTK